MTSKRLCAALSAAVLVLVSNEASAQPVPPPMPPPQPLPAVPAAQVAPAESPSQCVPGLQIACACGGASTGYQVCAEDGRRFGACICTASPPARVSLVPMNFLAYHGDDSYQVDVGGQRCQTPCSLMLQPGPAKLGAKGSGELSTQFVVPHLPAQVRVAHDSSAAYVSAGAALVPTGIVVASAMWAIGFACNYNDSSCYVANFTVWPILGVSMMTSGIVLLALSGKHRIPSDANHPEILDGSAAPGVRMTGLGVAPSKSGAVGALGFQF